MFQKVKALESEIANLQSNAQQQLASKDDLIRSLQGIALLGESGWLALLICNRTSQYVEEQV